MANSSAPVSNPSVPVSNSSSAHGHSRIKKGKYSAALKNYEASQAELQAQKDAKDAKLKRRNQRTTAEGLIRNKHTKTKQPAMNKVLQGLMMKYNK